MTELITIIGGGLAGCEAALTLARMGQPCRLWEMRPKIMTPAHHTGNLAELVCSNSLGSQEEGRAANLLKSELRLLGSHILKCAEQCSLSAGGALAVDRNIFSQSVTSLIVKTPSIELVREECLKIPTKGPVIVAAGPLLSDALAVDLVNYLIQNTLYFYDAISPIVSEDSIDKEKTFLGGRYSQSPDYLNCGMNQEEYLRFADELVDAETIPLREMDEGVYYEACIPIEEIAHRSVDAMRFGPLRPIGIHHPQFGTKYYAVVQLRRENTLGSAWNLVGFQTRLKQSEQQRIFRLIPGLDCAVFLRFGSAHRNTYVDGPANLSPMGQLKQHPSIFIAGQLGGVEGYLESTASGLLAGINVARLVNGQEPIVPSPTTLIGAMLHRIAGKGLIDDTRPIPVGAQYGLLPELETPCRDRKTRRISMDNRALQDLSSWIEEYRLF